MTTVHEDIINTAGILNRVCQLSQPAIKRLIVILQTFPMEDIQETAALHAPNSEMLEALKRAYQTVNNAANNLPAGELRTILSNEANNLRRDIAKAVAQP